MKIKLVKFQENDFEDYYSLVRNKKVMAQITECSIPYEEVEKNFQKILKRNERYESFGSYKIFEVSNKGFIGLGSLTLNEEWLKEAEIGYMLLPEYWGKGYGSEIARLLIEKARESKLKKLKAIIDPENIPSRKILTNFGFQSEKVCTIDGLPGEIMSKTL